MRIGIDAKWFYEGPISNRIVVTNLVESLVRNNDCHDLVFFLNRKHKNREFPFLQDNVRILYVWAGNNMISNLFLLPFYGLRLRLDGILYQNFASFWGPSVWVYIHDVIFMSHPQFFSRFEKLYFLFIPFFARFAKKIITISEAEKSRMLLYGVGSKESISVVYHGRNLSFKPKENFRMEDLLAVKKKYDLPGRYILYVGRLNVRKNIDNLLKAVQSLKESIPLIIIGKEDWKTDSEVNKLLNILLKSGQAKQLGHVPFEDLPQIYALAEVFCFPSFAEGFGLPVLEAMASGLSVVTSKNSAMEEICGPAGLFVDTTKAEEIRDGLQLLINNDELKAQFRSTGLDRSRLFDWNNSAQQIFKIITED